MRDIVKFWSEYKMFILLGVLIALFFVVVPMIIRGFFYLMLLGLKNPEHMMGYIVTAMVFYSLGMFLEKKNW